MDKKQYNDHLTKFHADTFKDYIIKLETSNNHYGASPANFINNAFKEYVKIYNATLAKPFLDSLKESIENLPVAKQFSSLLNDFPEIFLQTEECRNYKQSLLKKSAHNEIHSLLGKSYEQPIEPAQIKSNIINFTSNLFDIMKDIKDKNSEDIFLCYSALTDYLHEITSISFSPEKKGIPKSVLNPQDIKDSIVDILETKKNEFKINNCDTLSSVLQLSLQEINKHLEPLQEKSNKTGYIKTI